jgi:hypothetical protein
MGNHGTHLLPPCTSTTTTELLGLHPAGVGNKERTVVGDEGLLQLEGGRGILVLGVEAEMSAGTLRSEVELGCRHARKRAINSRDNTLGNGLAEGVELRDVTTTLHAETDVDVGKLLRAEDEDGLVDLVPEGSAGDRTTKRV